MERKFNLIALWFAPASWRLATIRNPSTLLATALFAASLTAVGYAANPPSGSYQKTCIVQSFGNSVLTAACRPENNPNFRSSQIDVRDCGAEIFNRDGGLQCFAKQGFGRGRAIPRGSYVDTCKDVIVTDDQKSISAQCKDRNGSFRSTKLTTSGCALGGRFDNDNGNLVCRH
jgi:hypothetical protein